MFYLGKIVGIFDEPFTWLILAWVLALRMQRRHPVSGMRLQWAILGVFLLSGFVRLADWPLRQLEAQYAMPSPAQIDQQVGVIVLGGSFSDPHLFLDHQQVPLNASAERLTQAVYLLREHPNWTLVFSGGEGHVMTTGISEGEMALQFFKEMGIDEKRIVIEQQSRTTRENAQLIQQALGDRCAQPWLLITSAWHMSRSMLSFASTSCQLTPYPTDYWTADSLPWYEYSLDKSMQHLKVALHEWLGLGYYKITSISTMMNSRTKE